MKQLIKFTLIFISINISWNSFGQTYNQVIIKGKQETKSHTLEDKIKEKIKDFFNSEERNFDDYERSEQNFTITCTSNVMKMEAELIAFEGFIEKDSNISENITREREVNRNKVSLELIFNTSGTGLTMNIFMKMGEDKKEMSLLTSAKVPKSESFTISEGIINLMQAGGKSGKLWKGHPTIEYNYEGEAKTESSMVNKRISDQDTIAKFIRKDKSKVILAQGVEGIEIMDEFYGRLLEGGYDIGGSDEGSLLSSIGYLLSEGMPIKIEENKSFDLVAVNDSKSINTYQSTTEIFSIETSDAEVSLLSKVSSDKNEATSAKSQEEKKPEGCDCSCEKYKELMAMGKKKKKDIDPSKMPKMDMSCIQECATQWANCAKN